MNNRKHESFDQRFLSPLKKRPGLEPDERFVEKLRAEIAEEQSIKMESRKPKWRWPILVPMAMAVLLFTVLAASFLETDMKQKNSDSADQAVIVKPKEEEKRDLSIIIASNKAYESIYKEITKVTGSPAVARTMVFYLDALEEGDKTLLTELLLFEYADNSMEEMIEYYKYANFTTFKIENMFPDEYNHFHIIFNYFDNEKNEQIRRRLLINMIDNKNLKIIDSVTLNPINPEKDSLVKEKVEFIESNFKTGMSEPEAAKLFGREFKEFVNSDAEDGTAKDWLYTYFTEEGAVSKVEYDHRIDFKNLVNQEIGLQFSIGWSTDKKAMRMAIFYTQNGKVFVKGIRSNGAVFEEEQVTGEIILDKTPFRLSEEEMAAYNWFKLEHDTDNLRDLPPLSIAKLYIQAGLDNDKETEYALFTTRSEYVMWTKEEHLEYAKYDKVSKEEILAAFQGLQNGEFIETSDFEGYIKFENENGTQGFRLVKEPDGIWKVGFMPIQ